MFMYLFLDLLQEEEQKYTNEIVKQKAFLHSQQMLIPCLRSSFILFSTQLYCLSSKPLYSELRNNYSKLIVYEDSGIDFFLRYSRIRHEIGSVYIMPSIVLKMIVYQCGCKCSVFSETGARKKDMFIQEIIAIFIYIAIWWSALDTAWLLSSNRTRICLYQINFYQLKHL